MEVGQTWEQRPPSGEQCTSGCEPGVLDGWVDIFFNILLQVVPGAEQAERLPSRQWNITMPLKERERGPYCSHIIKDLGLGLEGNAGGWSLLTRSIPGSTIETLKDAQRIREILSCLSEEGTWWKDSTPRMIPWRRFIPGKVKEVVLSSCDMSHKATGGIAGLEADMIVSEWRNATDQKSKEYLKYKWNIPPHLLWEWITPASCPLEHFSREIFCKYSTTC